MDGGGNITTRHFLTFVVTIFSFFLFLVFWGFSFFPPQNQWIPTHMPLFSNEESDIFVGRILHALLVLSTDGTNCWFL